MRKRKHDWPSLNNSQTVDTGRVCIKARNVGTEPVLHESQKARQASSKQEAHLEEVGTLLPRGIQLVHQLTGK